MVSSLQDKPEAGAALISIRPRPRTRVSTTAPLKRALLSAAGCAALLIVDQSAAWAACNLPAANDVTAICDGATTSRYGSGTETNGTITVNLSASLSVTGAYAIKFRSLTNVYNYGTITATPRLRTH